MPILCRTKELRRQYVDKFSAAGIEIRPMIAGNMTKQPFFHKYVETIFSLPNTDFIHENGFENFAPYALHITFASSYV